MWGYVDFLVRSACHRVSDNPKLLLWITFGYTSNSPGWYKNTTCTKYIFYWTQYPQKRSRREVVPETAFQSFSDTIVSPICSLWSQYRISDLLPYELPYSGTHFEKHVREVFPRTSWLANTENSIVWFSCFKRVLETNTNHNKWFMYVRENEQLPALIRSLQLYSSPFQAAKWSGVFLVTFEM